MITKTREAKAKRNKTDTFYFISDPFLLLFLENQYLRKEQELVATRMPWLYLPVKSDQWHKQNFFGSEGIEAGKRRLSNIDVANISNLGVWVCSLGSMLSRRLIALPVISGCWYAQDIMECGVIIIWPSGHLPPSRLPRPAALDGTRGSNGDHAHSLTSLPHINSLHSLLATFGVNKNKSNIELKPSLHSCPSPTYEWTLKSDSFT